MTPPYLSVAEEEVVTCLIFFCVCVEVSTASVLATCPLMQALVYGKYPEGHLCSPGSPCPVG